MAAAPMKSNILAAKKPGLGAKKMGLGAKKVNTDFKEIERNMQEQERAREMEAQEEVKTKEETEKTLEKQMASMRLAYDNLDKQREKESERMKQADPKKAQQLDRLGMAVTSRAGGVSHSALSDMQIIQQEGVFNKSSSFSKSSNGNFTKESSANGGSGGGGNSFFDDFETQFVPKSSGSSRFNDADDGLSDLKGFSGGKNSAKDDWTIIGESAKFEQPSSMYSYESDSRNNRSKLSTQSNTSGSTAGGDATKRFANAKSISSEQYFGNSRGSDFESKNTSSKFDNSKSISSDEYFGRAPTNKPSSNNAADLGMMTEDFKHGVSRMAGKLSNMASNVMTSFQDKL